jgi:sugar lactone lactonase YvrE
MFRGRTSRLAAALAAAAVAGTLAAGPAFASPGPIITEYAGNETLAPPTPGPATSSSVGVPAGIAVDSAGNIYLADQYNNEIEKVSSNGTLSIIAGNGTAGAPVPGPATSSPLSNPQGVAVDGAGNVYIADSANNVVEKVTPDGNLSIIAGNGSQGAPVAGPATSSPLSGLTDVAVDSAGNLYIADFGNSRVEKVTASGMLSVFAGNGSFGPPSPGPATSVAVGEPAGVAVAPDGSVYIVDFANGVLDRVATNGVLSVVAGTGTQGPPTPGPATSSELQAPWGVGIDAAGNLYIADQGNSVVEQVTPDGTLSIFAGNGSSGPPTYGGSPTGTGVNAVQGAVAIADGTVYLADSGNSTIDRVGLAAPGPPGQPVLAPGNGSAQLSFTPSLDPGTSAITSYQVSLDGGATWQTINTTASSDGTLTTMLSGLTNGTTYQVLVRAVNSSGPGADSPAGSVTPQSPAPTNTRVPMLSGTPGVGQTLACSQGSWAGGAAHYSYRWSRDGAPIPGATGQRYAVTPADEGHTLTCTVTAFNSVGGSTQATSRGVFIPIPDVSLCPKPSGLMAGTHLGPMWLGLSRSHARRKLPRFSPYSSHTDTFCLAGGWGIRAGYATRQLLRKLPGHPDVTGIVLLLTANPHYNLARIHPGMSVASAKARLELGMVIHLGRNSWYVIPGTKANRVLKTRHGVIQEIGIVDRQLTTTGLQRVRLLAHF